MAYHSVFTIISVELGDIQRRNIIKFKPICLNYSSELRQNEAPLWGIIPKILFFDLKFCDNRLNS